MVLTYYVAMLLLQLLSWRWVSCAVVEPHLVPGVAGLSVQDGAQASEAGVGTHLHAVRRGLSRWWRGQLDGTHVVCGLVRPSSPEVSQVREAQLLWLDRNKRQGQNIWTQSAYSPKNAGEQQTSSKCICLRHTRRQYKASRNVLLMLTQATVILSKLTGCHLVP